MLAQGLPAILKAYLDAIQRAQFTYWTTRETHGRLAGQVPHRLAEEATWLLIECDRVKFAGQSGFADDPVELFRNNVWINPFWEDDVHQVVELMGADRVIFGSDWPHIEALPHPLDYLREVKDFDDAIAIANDTDYGLQSGLFTQNVNRIMRAFEEIQVGGLQVNDVSTFRVDQMPYGGVKESGVGREGLRYAMEDFTYERVMVLTGLEL